MKSARGGLRRLVIVLAVTAAGAAHAQGHGGGPGGNGPGGGGRGSGMGLGGGGMSRGPFGGSANSYPNRPIPSSGDNQNSGLQLGPPGRWWDNGRFAQTIGLDLRQQQRMDDIFGENRGTLVKLYKTLQHEESQLARSIRARDLDEPTILQQIDRVAQARGELEKANAHMLLQIRKEMTPEQTARLDDRRPDL